LRWRRSASAGDQSTAQCASLAPYTLESLSAQRQLGLCLRVYIDWVVKLNAKELG
jgi:hypothetical protein